MVALTFGSFLLILVIGCPIGIALLLGGAIPLITGTNIPLVVITQRLFSSVNSYSIMQLIFYIMAGNIMATGGVSKRLVDLAKSLVGWLPGGLAVVAFFACALFGAISGSSPATVAAIGSIMIPAMKEEGYPLPFILATIASGGWLGIIVPPSIPMVIYGISAGGVSISELFMGGFIPGFLLAAGMSVYAVYYGKKNKLQTTPFALHRLRIAFVKSLWALGMPIIILGGIYAGIFTPTEAAAISVVYGLFVGTVVYKQISIKSLIRILRDSIIITNITMFIVATATIFGYVMTREQIPATVGNFILSIADNKFTFMLLVTLLLFFVGTFMETIPAIMILAPILTPMLTQYNINPIAFGVIMVINLGIGMITPPVGINLFTAVGLVGEKVEIVINKHLLIYMLFACIVMIILMVFDDIILYLPRVLSC